MQGCGEPNTAVFVASIDAMRIQGAALPDETLTTTATLVRELGPLAQFEFEVTTGTRAVAKGRVTLSRQLARAGLA